jgi:transcriptional regulator with XRE-family HTH domain
MNDGDVDPREINDRNDFGAALTLLRDRAGLTVRDIAKAVGIPAATAGDYFAGRALPSAKMAEVVPAIVRACGLTDPVALDQWRNSLIRIRRAPRAVRKAMPYRGLATFQIDDAEWFFGRDNLVADLKRKRAELGRAGVPLTVLGVSGSGKSSLLRAGMVAELAAEGRARTLLMTPGGNPCRRLADQLCQILRMPADRVDHVLHTNPALVGDLARRSSPATLVVDQLEELLVTGADPLIQRTFLTALDALSRAGIAVVFGLRADCHASAAGHRELHRSLAEAFVVGPMSEASLVAAITGPAGRSGVGVNADLVENLLGDFDVAARAWVPAESAGVPADPLPLLSHALLLSWRRRERGPLTAAHYAETGGLRDCVRRSAETALAALDARHRMLARDVFLDLVRADGGTTRIRRRVPTAVIATGVPDRMVENIVAHFAAQHLLTVGPGTVEIAHDAVLRAWPRLTAWLAGRASWSDEFSPRTGVSGIVDSGCPPAQSGR